MGDTLLSIFLIIFSTPAVVIGTVFAFKIKKPIKFLMLGLSFVSITLLIINYIILLVESFGSDTTMLLGIIDLAISIPSMCVSIHIYNKYKILYENNESNNRFGEESEISYIQEIKELKKLLDNGLINQEEYNKKKTEILNRK